MQLGKDNRKDIVVPSGIPDAGRVESLEMVKTGRSPKLLGISMLVLLVVSAIFVMCVPWSQVVVGGANVPLGCELWRQLNGLQPTARESGGATGTENKSSP